MDKRVDNDNLKQCFELWQKWDSSLLLFQRIKISLKHNSTFEYFLSEIYGGT